jgi:hypothetical protein
MPKAFLWCHANLRGVTVTPDRATARFAEVPPAWDRAVEIVHCAWQTTTATQGHAGSSHLQATSQKQQQVGRCGLWRSDGARAALRRRKQSGHPWPVSGGAQPRHPGALRSDPRRSPGRSALPGLVALSVCSRKEKAAATQLARGVAACILSSSAADLVRHRQVCSCANCLVRCLTIMPSSMALMTCLSSGGSCLIASN